MIEPQLFAQRLDSLLECYANLSQNNVEVLVRHYARDARFKDPFNEVRGVDHIHAIFEHMFVTTESPRFIIGDSILQNQQAFVTWTFHFGLQGKTYEIVGGSHLRFDDAGLIVDHRDYWDAAEELFQKLPLIGGLIRMLRRRFVVPL